MSMSIWVWVYEYENVSMSRWAWVHEYEYMSMSIWVWVHEYKYMSQKYFEGAWNRKCQYQLLACIVILKIKIFVKRTLNVTYFSQPLVLENKNAVVQNHKLHLLHLT